MPKKYHLGRMIAMKTKNIVIGGLLTALALVIPMVSFKLPLPYPFSVTFASHVPIMLAMFINPVIAVIAAAGSALGFLVTMGPVIAARAAMHIIFAYVGAVMIKKKSSIWLMAFVTMILHSVGEALIIQVLGESIVKLPEGYTMTKMSIFVGVGTAFHHAVDFAITYVVYAALEKAGLFKKYVLSN